MTAQRIGWEAAIEQHEPGAMTRIGQWWDRPGALALLVLLGAVPLLWPTLPPLTDLPGHMGRWHISMALHHSAVLARYFGFAWAPIGNLGMDLLVPMLAIPLGLEPATRLAVILIVLLNGIGLLWSAREAHGRLPPLAIAALPLIYGWPFQFGFVNFALAQALAFCALALWLRLGRSGQLGLRAVLFVPISCLLWLCHDFGWGMFGLMAFGAELARLKGRERPWRDAISGATLQCIPLILPALFMTLHHSHSARGNSTGDWFDIPVKVVWLLSVLRDRWPSLDLSSAALILVLLYLAGREHRIGFTPILAWPALLCAAAFVFLPRFLLGGAYVDMRIAPAALMLGLIAARPPNSVRLSRYLAIVATFFFLAHTAATTASFVLRDGEQRSELGAISAIPRGASVFVLARKRCGGWSDMRPDHLASMAIVRRDAFTNDQWDLDGQQLLTVRHTAAAPYLADPSQLVFPANCHDIGSDFGRAVTGFPASAFTHVWTIGFPPGAARAPNLRLIWSNGRSALYRVTPLTARRP